MIKGLLMENAGPLCGKPFQTIMYPVYNDPEDFRSRSSDRSYSGGDLWNLFHNEI